MTVQPFFPDHADFIGSVGSAPATIYNSNGNITYTSTTTLGPFDCSAFSILQVRAGPGANSATVFTARFDFYGDNVVTPNNLIASTTLASTLGIPIRADIPTMGGAFTVTLTNLPGGANSAALMVIVGRNGIARPQLVDFQFIRIGAVGVAGGGSVQASCQCVTTGEGVMYGFSTLSNYEARMDILDDGGALNGSLVLSDPTAAGSKQSIVKIPPRLIRFSITNFNAGAATVQGGIQLVV